MAHDDLPTAVRYLIVGAGVHGLSTAWHLAQGLKARGEGGGEDVLVLDKTAVGAGASGIACGVVRNNYFQPAMRRLMAHSVSVWESDPAAFSYHPVGYLQAAPESMREGVVQIHAEQQEIGYPSRLVEGERDCRSYLQDLFGDWQAPGITNVLHERRGGYANNQASMRGLADKARAQGVSVRTGVRVTGLDLADGAVRAVMTDRGSVRCENLVVAVGPWVRDLWQMLELPATIDVRSPDVSVKRPGQPGVRRVTGVRAHVDGGAGALPRPVPGHPPPLPGRGLRRPGLLHPRQLPRLRHLPAERLRDRRLQPRLQDDRGRRPGG